MNLPRVLADPCGHPYLARLDRVCAQLVQPAAELGRDPDWIERHSDRWDVAHLHLGLAPWDLGTAAGQETPPDDDWVDAVVEAHRRRGTPIAVTVHDLGHPRGPTAPDHTRSSTIDLLRRIEVSLSAIITLTSTCATVLQDALDRPVRVIPPGPVLTPSARQRLRASGRLAGGAGPLLLVAGDLPPRLGWSEAIDAVSRTFTSRHLQILVDEAHAATVRRAADPHRQVSVHAVAAASADRELRRAVATARAVVLPWRWGDHSWLIELAADVGTPVVATDVGFMADQHPVLEVRCADGQIDVDDLAAAMDTDVHAGVGDVDRDTAATAFRCGHDRLYRHLLLGRRDDVPRSRVRVG